MQLHTVLRTSYVAVCSAVAVNYPKNSFLIIGNPIKQSPGLYCFCPSNLLWLRHKRRDSSVSVVFFRRIPFCSRTPSTPLWRKKCVPDTFFLALRISSEQIKKVCTRHTFLIWRRRRDSNSRTGLTVTRFPVVRPRPARRLLRMLFN